MSDAAALSQSQIENELKKLPDWSVRSGKLHAEYKFKDFVEAFSFMTKVAFAAEAAEHHPEWSNVYNRVTIDLMTHDAGNAITQRDVELARRIHSLAT
jgi:4a-hydroxytetrahydrobiopterin dehydratase